MLYNKLYNKLHMHGARSHGKIYKIPIQSSADVMLSCTGDDIISAALEISNCVISTIHVTSTTQVLDFLGGKPLRAGLLAPRQAYVLLYCATRTRAPSLLMQEVGKTQWILDYHVDDVSVVCNANSKTQNKLIYIGGEAHLFQT